MALSPSVHENWQISLWQVARSNYSHLHVHVLRPQWAFSFVKAGEVCTSAGGEKYLAPSGSLMIHPPDLPYDEKNGGAGIHEWFVFEARVSPGLDVMRLFPLPPVIELGASGATYSQIFAALLANWNGKSRFRDLKCACLAGELVALVLETWEAQGKPARPASFATPNDRFAELVLFMRENLGEKLTRETLARRLRLHPNYLDRAFALAHGQTPLQMLREMLESSDWTLGAIAQKVGLENDAYLSRVFRKRFGTSPGAHRAALKNAQTGYLPVEP